MLIAVFDLLDGAGIRYCVSHGYDNYPSHVSSDVDFIVDRSVSLTRLLALLRSGQDRLGGEPVRCFGRYIVLAGPCAGSGPVFLHLDFSADAEIDDVRYFDGDEVLATRRRLRGFWVPSHNLEFGIRLTRMIAKGRVDDDHWAALSALFQNDAVGCEREVRRFWRGGSAETILSALTADGSLSARRHLKVLQAELRTRSIMRHPFAYLKGRARNAAARISRLISPGGVYVALLGPDGAGKSSLIEALQTRLADGFARTACHGFTPAFIHRLRHGEYRPNAVPHALRPRSFLQSVVRAIFYWGGYYTLGYGLRRLDLARTTFVLNDRHFIDVLVDPRRYRYGGPMWLVRAIARCIPKPDLFLLLDAPANVLQSRKQEVPIEETARQRQAYLELVRPLSNGRVIDCTRALDCVATDASNLILKYMALRVSERWKAAGSQWDGSQLASISTSTQARLCE